MMEQWIIISGSGMIESSTRCYTAPVSSLVERQIIKWLDHIGIRRYDDAVREK